MKIDAKIIIPILFLVLLAGILLLNKKKHNFEPPPEIVDPIASISSSVGKILFRSKSSNLEISELDYPEKIFHSGELKTFPGSNVQITFDGDWVIDILENSHLQFQHWGNEESSKTLLHFYEGGYEVLNKGNDNNLLFLYKGEFYAVDEKFNDKKSLSLEIIAQKLNDQKSDPHEDEKQTQQKNLPPPETLNEQEQSTRYIETSIFKKRHLFEKCLANRIRENNPVSGRILMGFSVTELGTLKDVNVIENKTQDRQIENCVIDVFSRIKIRNYSGDKTFFAFPIDFK